MGIGLCHLFRDLLVELAAKHFFRSPAIEIGGFADRLSHFLQHLAVERLADKRVECLAQLSPSLASAVCSRRPLSSWASLTG